MSRKTGFVNREAGKGEMNLPLSVFLKLPAVNTAGGFISESMTERKPLDCPQFVPSSTSRLIRNGPKE